MQKYVIYYEDMFSDNEMERSRTTASRKYIKAVDDVDALRQMNKFEKDCNEADECSDAMGGGCFNSSTNVIGIRKVGSKDWVKKQSEPELEKGTRSKIRKWGEMTPYGRRDEYGGL